MHEQNTQNQQDTPMQSPAQPQGDAPKPKAKRALIIVAVIAVLVVVISVVVWYMVSRNSTPTNTAPQTNTSEPTFSVTVLEKGKQILPNGHADPTVVATSTGYRMYANRQSGGPGGVLIYKSTDGVNWQKEKDVILPGVSTSRAVAWPGGGVRLYYPGPMPIKPTDPQANMYSSYSADGLNFTKDPGTVIEPKSSAYYVEGPTVFQLADKTWRMYFNENSVAAGNQRDGIIWGASSNDGKTWQRDTDPTLQADDTEQGQASNPNDWKQVLHPFVISNPKGGYIMFYNAHSEIYAATSNDGINWTKHGKVGIHGADVDGYFQQDGTLRMYYGDFTQATGGLVYTAVVKIEE